MAKGKSVSFVWFCQAKDEGHKTHISGSGQAQKEKIKDMTRMKYCSKLRKQAPQQAKAVKKGGTKALANAK